MPQQEGKSTRRTDLRDAIVLFALVVIGASLCNLSQTGLNAMISPVMDELGGTPLDAGLVAFPSTFTAIAVNPIAGMLADKHGVRKVVLVTGAFLVIGSVGCVFIDETTSLAQLTFFQTVRAASVSGLVGPILTYALSGLEPRIVPDGSASVALLRQAAGSFGTAVMVFLVTAFMATPSGGASFMGIAASPALPYQVSLAFSALLALGLFTFMAVRLK